jgi:signal transduction histidine kinase
MTTTPNAPMPKPLSPVAKEVRIDFSKIWRRLQLHCKVDYCPRNPWPITIETDPAGLEAAINNLVSDAIRALADQVVSERNSFLSPGTAAGIHAEILAIATELRTDA